MKLLLDIPRLGTPGLKGGVTSSATYVKDTAVSTTRIVKERDWTKEKKLAQDAGTATKECALLTQSAGTGKDEYSCAVSQSQAVIGVFNTQTFAVSLWCRPAVQAAAGGHQLALRRYALAVKRHRGC